MRRELELVTGNVRNQRLVGLKKCKLRFLPDWMKSSHAS